MDTVLLATSIVVALLLSGCAQYEPKPIGSREVEHALQPPDAPAIRVATAAIRHPTVQPMSIDLTAGVSPEEAGVLAVVINPTLRAERDARSLAAAQLLQAGILPNPTLSAGVELPHNTPAPDNLTGYNVGLDWEISSLITHDAKVRASKASRDAVDLDVAWKEWQTAQAAKTAAYGVIALRAALNTARQADQRQAQNLDLIRRAVDDHAKTLLDLSAAQASAQEAHATVLAGENELQRQVSTLNRAIGVLPDSKIELRSNVVLPSHLEPPPAGQLLAGLEDRRLDLLALKKGYESEDQTLRAAILGQFPKINAGVNAARDTSDVKTIGLGISIDIPLFDRNQGAIATETATRQKLFDEYVSRVFDARWDIAVAIDAIRSANAQIADAEAALPDLQKFETVYRDALSRGNADVLSYRLAQAALIQKQLAIVRLRQQLIENWIALELAAGQYLPMQSTTSSPTTQEAAK